MSYLQYFHGHNVTDILGRHTGTERPSVLEEKIFEECPHKEVHFGLIILSRILLLPTPALECL